MRVTAVRDISERTRLEAELRQRETLAAMGSLVAGVAHEVRNPLFSLSAALDAMEARPGAPREDEELRSLLRPQVRRLSNLMEDLLDYGRPPRLRLLRGGVTDAVRRAARSCERLAAQAGVSVRLEVHGGLPELDLDVGRIEQVFENLIANAIQLSPRGGTVRVTARPEEGPARGVRVTVADEGPGLAPADLERIFEPFFSLRSGGTGLGLPIAHRFVQAHGGTLRAANGAQGGALFTVFLPVVIGPPDPSSAEGR
jgi:signal transduction histidine kinase